MAFNTVINFSMIASDGGSAAIAKTIAANEKALFDHVFVPGTHNLSSFLAQLNQVKALFLAAEVADFVYSLDGVNFSPRRYRTIYLDTADAGVTTLLITLTQQTRVQLFAIGD